MAAMYTKRHSYEKIGPIAAKLNSTCKANNAFLATELLNTSSITFDVIVL
ncbi:hypothetical protein MCHI_001659 [Candidatus Magnetoovum chiemensis]|nr:hypothetical protein MCHI_001659 [Candidatus Magnetoovum chiemensis]